MAFVYLQTACINGIVYTFGEIFVTFYALMLMALMCPLTCKAVDTLFIINIKLFYVSKAWSTLMDWCKHIFMAWCIS